MSHLACMFDVDNTLLDNDRIKHDFGVKLDALLGSGTSQHYWQVYETLRDELGYADYLATVQRCWKDAGRDPRWLPSAGFMLDCHFPEYLYPGALAALEHVRELASTWIVSDGDAVFQPHKVRHSGLWQAFDGNVLIYRHKQHELADIEARCQADHYVMIDDKLRLLDAMKQQWGPRLTTVWVRQGHYALSTDGHAPADITIEHIGDLVTFSGDDLRRAATDTTAVKETP
ncbi:MAG: HAD family hydrolase [Xanthomonadales bacterium]|nr:HAD family hydrolase [Xanthomonadales bacterium]